MFTINGIVSTHDKCQVHQTHHLDCQYSRQVSGSSDTSSGLSIITTSVRFIRHIIWTVNTHDKCQVHQTHHLDCQYSLQVSGSSDQSSGLNTHDKCQVRQIHRHNRSVRRTSTCWERSRHSNTCTPRLNNRQEAEPLHNVQINII